MQYVKIYMVLCTPKDYHNGRRLSLFWEGTLFALLNKGGGDNGYIQELFLLGTLLVSIIALVINITKKK